MAIIDGKALSLDKENVLKSRIQSLIDQNKRRPQLAVILIGEDPASMSYVAGKEKACMRVGILSSVFRLSETIEETNLLKLIETLNQDKDIDGILVQLPLPKHIHTQSIIQAIDPSKDVDGLHPINVAKLYANQKGFVPCTPKGIMSLLEAYHINIAGKDAVVIGRSALVGRPIAQLLLNQNATVTMCHSKTKDIAHHTKQADIIVVAIGKALYLDASFISNHPVVIDVGITRVDHKLVGDVDFDAIHDQCHWITPVPGGVGPMTIVSLLENTLEAYEQHAQEAHHAHL